MENDYRITKLHGTLIGDNRIPDLPAGEKTKVFSSTNGKTAWVDLPDGGEIEVIDGTVISAQGNETEFTIETEPKGKVFLLKLPLVSILMSLMLPSDNTYCGFCFGGTGSFGVIVEAKTKTGAMLSISTDYWLNADSTKNGKFLSVVEGIPEWSDLPDGGELELIEVSNATINHDGSYTYTLPKKPTSNPYILKTVDSGESDYYLMTGDSDVSFGMRPIALTDSLFGGNFMLVSGTTATQRPTYFPPKPKSADNGKVLTVNNGYPSWETVGGASVSPCLKLVDNSGDTPVYKTSLTEEEKANLDNGLYTSVFYADPSSETSDFSVYLPETLITPAPEFAMFSMFNLLPDETTGAFTMTGASVFSMEIGEKSADNTYPITIEKAFDINIGGESTSSSSFEEATLSQLSGFKGQYKALHITDCNVVFNFQEIGEITSNSVYFVGFVNSETQLEGTVWTIFGGNPVCLCTGTFYITNGVINGGHCTIGSLNSVSVGSLLTFGGTRSFNSKDATNAIGLYGVQGCEYAGKVDVVSNGATAKKSALTIISNVNKEATGESAFCEMDGLFEGYGLGRMVLKKDANNSPQFKSFTTWLPPVTTASEGKALIVTDGNAQWTTTPRYEHTITIKNSEGKILWTQTLRNSKDTVVNSYTNLKTLFGEATYAGFGEYCQLNLEGGTEATDKLIKADGTEVTLASLGAIVYTDKCFLPK